MQPPQAVRIVCAAPRYVDVLATHHAFHPSRRGELARSREQPARLCPLLGEEEAEGFGVEGITREDRHVLPESPMTGRLAAAQVVVVHRWQVVVDEGIG